MICFFMVLSTCFLSAEVSSRTPLEWRENIAQQVNEGIFKIRRHGESVPAGFKSISEVVHYMGDVDPTEMMFIFGQLRDALKPIQQVSGIEDVSLGLEWSYAATPGSFASDVASLYRLGARLGRKASSDDELLGTLLHEASHIKHNDVALRQLLLVIPGALLIGFRFLIHLKSQRIAIGLLGALLLSLRCYTYCAQYQEKRADMFAAQFGFAKSLARYLSAIKAENSAYSHKQNIFLRTLYQWFAAEHPDIDERIAYLNRYDAESDSTVNAHG